MTFTRSHNLNALALEFELQDDYKICATPSSHSKEDLWGRMIAIKWLAGNEEQLSEHFYCWICRRGCKECRSDQAQLRLDIEAEPTVPNYWFTGTGYYSETSYGKRKKKRRKLEINLSLIWLC